MLGDLGHISSLCLRFPVYQVVNMMVPASGSCEAQRMNGIWSPINARTALRTFIVVVGLCGVSLRPALGHLGRAGCIPEPPGHIMDVSRLYTPAAPPPGSLEGSGELAH